VKKIVVCSDHTILVTGFRSMIAEPAGFRVFQCTEVTDLRAHLGETSAPDLILIDANHTVTLHGLAELKSLSPDSGLILWVDWISQEFVRDAIKSGVRGILRKDASAELYSQCLTQVAAGQLWLENEMSQKLLSARAIRLSPRERQLIGLLTEGLRNKEIAARMTITEGTAKAYLSRLFEKTGASDRFELAMFALKNLETNPATGPSRGPRIFLPLRNAFSRQA
jgi:two-component system, NarL family, nitrate/nitrite response regulator NarL